MTHGWGGRFSYTYSVLKDNQVGETNFYTEQRRRRADQQLQLRRRRCRHARRRLTRVDNYSQMCFDPLVDYGTGILDVPHRFIVAPIVAAAVRQGSRDRQEPHRQRCSPAAGPRRRSSTLQSGFPIGVSQSNSNSNLLGNRQRPNLVTGVDTSTTGDRPDRLASADHPSAAWLNQAAFATAAAGHLRQRAARHHRQRGRRFRPKPTCPSRRTVGTRRRQAGADQDRDHQPVQSVCSCGAIR